MKAMLESVRVRISDLGDKVNGLSKVMGWVS